MAATIDGATITVGADLGPSRAPFVLDRDTVDTAGMILTPASSALVPLEGETITVDGAWGVADLEGPVYVVDAGTMTVVLLDEDRNYDPSNPTLPDPPSVGRALAIVIDGSTIWTGRITRVVHDWAAMITTIEAEDAIAEASRMGVTVDLPHATINAQLWALVNASGWPSTRFRIVGATVRERDAERFTGSLLEGLQRLQLAELGALFAEATGVITFRTRGQGPTSVTSRATVGLEPGVGVTNIETSTDARIINAVYLEPDAGPTLRYIDPPSVSAYGEVALEVAQADLLLTGGGGAILAAMPAPLAAVLEAPTLSQPSGPRSPYAEVDFRFPDGSLAPDRYDVQMTSDPTFAAIDLWHYTQQTAGLNGYEVATGYLGPAPVIGVYYYWRARGRNGAAIGPWSRSVRWSPDPTAVASPYASWARAVLADAALPAPLVVLGTLLPEGPEVLAVTGTEYGGRWLVRDDRHPPPTSQPVAVFGLTLHVDHEGGWEVEGLTANVPPGDLAP